jgi:hypothetical protein
MGNFLDVTEDRVDFYEVTTPEGIAVWGGGDSLEAVRYFRQLLGARMFVSTWSEDGEDARMIGMPIEITKLITDAIADTMERKMQWR